MIPKVINYCWFGGKDLPWDAKRCINTWKKYCKDYVIKEWNESNFDVNCHPFISEAYKAKQWAFVSDYARLKIIYENGGIYLDTDVELRKSLDPLLEHKCYMGIAQNGNISSGLGFGAIKHHETVLRMLKQYDELQFDINNIITCPVLNTSLFKEYGYMHKDEKQVILDVILYPARYFDPIRPGVNTNLICADTFSIHNYSASWCGTSSRLRRKIITLIGAERFNKIRNLLKNKD